MKKKRNICKRALLAFIAILLLVVSGFASPCRWEQGKATQTVYAEMKKETKEKQFEIESRTRLGNKAKYNLKSEIISKVTNRGEDFAGFIQVIMYDVESGKNIMYQDDLILAAGETKNIVQEVHVSGNASQIMVRVTDEKEHVLQRKKVKVTMRYPSNIFLGILTDEKTSMSYLENGMDRDRDCFYLTKEDISSLAGISALNVVFIDNFNTADFSKEQYEVLKDWVEQGGTLILGTGEQVTRTLAMFQDDYISGSLGEGKNGEAAFSFEGEKITKDENSGLNFHRLQKGLGSICIAEQELGLKGEKDKKEQAYRTALEEQYSEAIKTILNSKFNSNYYYNDNSMLESSRVVPSLKGLSWIYAGYIVLITFFLYLVLKKKDKQDWTWWLIPTLSVLCSGVVILMGSGTRISGIQINYAKILNFTETDTQNVKTITTLDVQSSENNDYQVNIPEKYDVYTKISSDYFENLSDSELKRNYRVGFLNQNGKKIVSFKNNSAFEKNSLVSEGVEEVGGGLKTDLKFVDGKLTGTITNQSDADLSHVILMMDKKMYQIGELKAGDCVKVTEKNKNLFVYDIYMNPNNVLHTEHSICELLQLSTDTKSWKLEEARYVKEIAKEVDDYRYGTQEQAKMVGLVKNNKNDEKKMRKDWGVKCKGIVLAKFEFSVNYETVDGKCYVPDIVAAGNITSGSYCLDYEERTLYGEEPFEVEYKIEDNEKITSIIFAKDNNPSIDGSTASMEISENSFKGTIKAYNWKKKKYEEIFEYNKEGKLTKTEDYVSDTGVVKIQMEAPEKNRGAFIPVISLEKEEK